MNTPMLFKRADHILTMDDQRREFRGQDVLASHGKIIEIGVGLAPIGNHHTLDA
jgi:hypothetical protein